MAAQQWTEEEEKMFEQSLAVYTERSPDQFENIALFINKPVEEVKEHYEALSRDLWMIESGLLDEPVNMGLVSTNPISLDSKQGDMVTPVATLASTNSISLGSKQGDNKRKRGNSWSVDEHRRFLIGLKRYGKGDWRGISRNLVVTRTPSQVASHAQKYFIRQTLGKTEKKRSSIHDITIEDTSLATPPNMDWTGQQETSIPLQSQPWQQPQLYQQPVNSTRQQETLIPLPSQQWQQPQLYQQPVNSTGQQETLIPLQSEQWQQSQPYQQPVNSTGQQETPIPLQSEQWQQSQPYQQPVNSIGPQETPIPLQSEQWQQSQPYQQPVNSIGPQETPIPPQAQPWQQPQLYQQPIDSTGQQETLILPQPQAEPLPQPCMCWGLSCTKLN